MGEVEKVRISSLGSITEQSQWVEEGSSHSEEEHMNPILSDLMEGDPFEESANEISAEWTADTVTQKEKEKSHRTCFSAAWLKRIIYCR